MSEPIRTDEYVIHATCLAPVVIRTGEEIMPWEYAIVNNRLFRFDLGDFYETLDRGERASFRAEIDGQGALGARKWAYERLRADDFEVLQSIAAYDIPVERSLVEAYGKNISKRTYDQEGNQLVLHAFPRSKEGFFVPGSSMKGALRSVLVHSLLSQGGDAAAYAKQVEGLDIKKDVSADGFRGFRVRDAAVPNAAVGVGGFRRSEKLPTYGEYLNTGTEFDVRIDTVAFPDQPQFLDFSPETLTAAGRAYAEWNIGSYLKELERFERLIGTMSRPGTAERNKLDRIGETRDFFEKLLLRMQERPSTFVLPIGFGVGYWHKVVLNEKRHPSSGTDMIKHYEDPSLQISRTWWHTSASSVVGFMQCTIL